MNGSVANSSASRSIIHRLSRSAFGRATGRFSRLIGHSATIQAAGRFLRRQLWAWPIIAAVVLGSVGWWIYHAVESSMRQQRAQELTTVLDADVAALRVWMADQERIAELIAADDQLRPLVQELLALADGKAGADRQLVQSKAQEAMRTRLGGRLRQYGYTGFFLVSPTGVVLAAEQDIPVGKALGGYRQEFFDRVMEHGPSVSKPYRSPLLLADEQGELKAQLPTMFAAAPVSNESGKPLAVLGLRIRPEEEFTRILQTARSGETGETFAFDQNGLFLSQSRFDEDLKQIGLLADLPDSKSVLTLELRDPGANMAEGERPKARRIHQPLTRMAADAVLGTTGYDVDGYRDYRGVPVVGAWTWLPEYDFGVATEIDVAEAFRPVYILRRVFWVVMVLLLLGSVGMFVAMLIMARQQAALQRAVLEAKQLGQYRLEEKLGAGGMGTVYKARHAMLRRPTAVKLLDVDKISDAAVARFEREVQLTSLLNHPNTIAIYDYGRTPEGLFYYAMEYLDGINLEDLVRRHGPQPEGRVVAILRQVCGPLAEAHAAGLIHRDIKPANIVLTCRGGIWDFVKVLDFGLVKALGGEHQARVTAADTLMGTPLYLSPEAVQQPDSVDSRADLYAVGAVGYFLLTGSPVFRGESVMEICMQHVKAAPEPPSSRLGREISRGLEAIILQCLAKNREQRPASADALIDELEQCETKTSWSRADAAAWWHNTKALVGSATTAAAPPAPAPEETSAYQKDQVPGL